MKTTLLTTAVWALTAAVGYGQVRAAEAGSAEAMQRIMEFEDGKPSPHKKGRKPVKTVEPDKPLPAEAGKLLEGLSDVEKMYVRACVKDNGKTPALRWGTGAPASSLRTGDCGILNFPPGVIVRQVLSNNEMLVSGEGDYEHELGYLWIEGVSTANVVDGSRIFPRRVLVVAGNKTYTNVLGASKTVMRLVALDTKKADTVLAKIMELKRHEERSVAEAKRRAAEAAKERAEKRLHDAKTRTWRSGKYTIKAEFVRASAGNVILKRLDTGEEIQVPMEILSEEDQDFIRNREWLQREALLNRFAGRWRIADERGVTACFFTLTRDFRATKSHAPEVTSKWEIVDNEVRITWSDGWLNTIQPQGRDFVVLAFRPGTSWDDPPTHTYQAFKEPVK